MKNKQLTYRQKTIIYFVAAFVAYTVVFAIFADWGTPATYILYFAPLIIFAIVLIIIGYTSDKLWSVMDILNKFVGDAEKGTPDYDTVRFPDTASGETGNKIISLYKQLENSKLEIIKEKDRNRQMKQR